MAERVCPCWVGYILASPIRKLFQNPKKILGDYVKPGLTVLDIGCAMGFFSLAMAKIVGPNGRVVCVDLQENMIKSLRRRAARAGLSDRIDPRVCTEQSLEVNDLAGQIDFALAFYVVHEVPDIPGLMAQVYEVLKPGGKLYVVEPKGHASAEDCELTKATALEAGFTFLDHPKMGKEWAAIFIKG